MSPYPEHWVKVPIGDICKLINGRAFKPSEWADHGLPIIRIQNLNNPNATYNYFNGIVEERHRIETGDLLFAWSGTPGTSFGAHIWEHGSAVLNQHIFKLIFNSDLVDSSFLRFAINDTLDELILQAHGGVGLRHITKGKLEATEIRLPPLEEQRRIATALRGYLTRISSIRADLLYARDLGIRYKESILDVAFGDETGNKSSAEFMLLSDFVDEGPTNGWSPKTGPDAMGALSLKLTATTSGYLRLDEAAVKRLYERPEESSRYWLRPGDLLVQRANAMEHLGATAIYDGPPLTYVYPDLMMRLRISDSHQRRYLWRYLNSNAAKRFLRSRATGTAGNMPKINGETLRSLPIPLPPSGDFAEVADRIERCFTEMDSVLQTIESSSATLSILEKAILQQALCGKLNTADKSDGSASDLLFEIQQAAVSSKVLAKSSRSRAVSGSAQRKAKEINMASRVRADVAPDHLRVTLISLGGATSPRELWRKSEMTIDEFYKQLRQEIEDGGILASAGHDKLVIQDAS
ncbi:restriction endonuclease subunit S [Yersinia enterocolitica]|nr:restriction endonuclease subunit S [Yersinia enterocolitica]HEI6762395.1 restriction endonuclease subunit S [Yersinia enterocolitica]HEI6827565.1 restriction endonuclease subunit S [Yersinia enterocolitica]HEI6869696.1 restriction endonuclease subunit S [Yersinia enterocolitica]